MSSTLADLGLAAEHWFQIFAAEFGALERVTEGCPDNSVRRSVHSRRRCYEPALGLLRSNTYVPGHRTTCMTLIAQDRLRGFAADLLLGAGAAESNARAVAESLVRADLRGHGSHGVIRIPLYARMAESGALNPTASPEVSGRGATGARVEGNRAFGQVVGRRAVAALTERANEHGVAAVGIRYATHLGRIGEWAEETVDEGLVFAAFVNTQGGDASLTVAPDGSADRKLATNPVAIGLPTFSELDFPLVLDMATSQVAHGKITRKDATGESLPEGWTVDRDGSSVTDAGAFEAGTGALRPLGGAVSGYKGFGLAVMAELLAGLVGDAPVAGASDEELFNNAAAFVAIDPLRFTTEERARRRVRGLVEHLRAADFTHDVSSGAAARAPDAGDGAPSDTGLLPGEAEHRTANRQAEEGIDLQDGVVDDLTEFAGTVDVSAPAEFQ